MLCACRAHTHRPEHAPTAPTYAQTTHAGACTSCVTLKLHGTAAFGAASCPHVLPLLASGDVPGIGLECVEGAQSAQLIRICSSSGTKAQAQGLFRQW